MIRKLICCWIVVCGIVELGYGQRLSRQTWGVQAGVSTATYGLSHIRSGVSREAAWTYNGYVGVWGQYSLIRYLGVETGVGISGLGARLEKSEFGTSEVTQHTYWLQVPVSLVGKLPLRDSSNFFLKAGIYGGYGLFGKNYVSDSYSGSASREFSFSSDGTQSRTDYGLQLGLGYQLNNGYYLMVGYQKGLSDLATGREAYEQRNQSYNVGIGYRF